jgi:hypothetical protein
MDGGPPAGAMTPPYGGPGGGPPTGPGAGGPGMGPAMVPAGPTHAPAKKGGNGLIIGLAALAVLLIGGGVLALLLRGGKPKVVVTDGLDLSGSASASAAPVESATAATANDADAAVAAATPLGGTVVAAGGTKPATGGTKPANTPSARPVPTPQPKADPPICAKARAARAANRPTAPALESACRSAGGTP